MAKEVFNRYESKFLLDEITYQHLQKELLKYMEPDAYNQNQEFYTISNIYYDTKDNYLIRNSLQKPVYKEKLRLRAYGVPEEDGKAYLEIKKKFKGCVNKRRTTLGLREAYQFTSTGIIPEPKPYMNNQVIQELAYMIQFYNVEPKLYLAYDRKAFFGKEDKSLRITFDTNIRSRRYDLALEKGDYGERLLEQGKYLMEVKAGASIPLWLSQLLAHHKVYKTSFSKYGTEYKRLIITSQQLKGVSEVC